MGLPKSHLSFFAGYIEDELGIIFKDENYYQLEKRLWDICKNLELEDPNVLYLNVRKDGIKGHIRQLLLDLATNNETSFFRDPKLWDSLRSSFLPALQKEFEKLPVLRVWSAASSFGQEPYSLAMIATELKEKDPSFPRLDIWATDVSEIALKKAKEGKYSQLEVQRGLPAPMLVKYFKKKEDDHWYASPELRTMVRFEKKNLLDLSGIIGKFHVIFCRNVLIYQNEERKKAILANLTQFLEPGGYLILGSAESLLGLSDSFEQVALNGAIFFRKKAE